jgi:hypothetical protein
VVHIVTTVKWLDLFGTHTAYRIIISRLYTYWCVRVAAALNVYTFVILAHSVNCNAGETFMRSLIRTNKAWVRVIRLLLPQGNERTRWPQAITVRTCRDAWRTANESAQNSGTDALHRRSMSKSHCVGVHPIVSPKDGNDSYQNVVLCSEAQIITEVRKFTYQTFHTFKKKGGEFLD